MKPKLFFPVMCVLMLVMTIGTAMAYFDWTQALINTPTGNPYTDFNVLSRTDMVAGVWTDGCDLPPRSTFQVLTDNITHNIWIEEYSTLSIYSKTCQLLGQYQVNGTFVGNGFMLNWDGDGNPDMVSVVKTPDATISIVSYEWNGATITKNKEIDLGSGVTSSSSIFCERGSNLCAVYNNDGYIRRINIVSGGYTTTASVIGGFNYVGITGVGSITDQWLDTYTYPLISNGLTWGDVDQDGHQEVIFFDSDDYYATQYYKGWDVMLYDIIDDTIDYSYNFDSAHTLTGCGYSSSGGPTGSYMGFVGSPFWIGRIGANNSVPKIFFACSSDTPVGDRHIFKVMDTNWNVLHSFIDTTTSGSGDMRMSNPVFGDVDHDAQLEVCIVLKANLECFEGNYSTLSNCSIPDYIGEAQPAKPISIMMADYFNIDGNKEIISVYGIHQLDCNEDSMGTYDSSDMVIMNMVDLSNDGLLDLLWMDSGSGMFMTTGGGGTGCSDSDFNGTTPAFNPLVFGTINGTNTTTASDYCYNSTMLIEQSCWNDNSPNSPVFVNCYQDFQQGVCQGGVCVPGNQSYCVDTDFNGTYVSDDPFHIGQVSGSNVTTHTDYCVGDMLYEYVCINSATGSNIPEAINCSYNYGKTCDNGQCVARNVQLCHDSDGGFGYPYGLYGNITITLNGNPYYSVNDSCYNSTLLSEKYCVNSSNYAIQAYNCANDQALCIGGRCDNGESQVCAQLGGVYINNTCVYNVSATCSDNDTTPGVYPTKNYTKKGTINVEGMLPQSDYCYGDFLYEFWCDNSTGYPEYAELYDCAEFGMLCNDGACVAPTQNGTCTDTDRLTFPTLNETRKGVVTITINGTTENFTDECAGNMLTEYYCNNYNLPVVAYTYYTCYIYGMDCLNGSCVPRVNQTCEDTDKAYSKPQTIAGSVIMRVNGVVSLQTPDECYNTTILRERVCRDNETPGTEAFDCSISGGTCSNSRCVYPNEDIGISQSDLKWCWAENGTFDWSCCSESEQTSKSPLCPARTLFKFGLGSIATFVFNNFIYFLILIIIFVLLAPFIVPKLRGDQ